ncbi:ribonuclease H-like domain-containing protein [Tanacetum coccineum]
MQGFFSWFLGFTSVLGDLLYFLDQLRTPLILRNDLRGVRLKDEGYEVLEGFWRGDVAAARKEQQGGDVASLVAKERNRGACKLLGWLLDHLGKFDGKADEGFFVGYSLNSKAFRVFNSRTRIVEENLHISFSESIPNVVGSGPDWLFDIDALTRTMYYEPIVAGTQSNDFADTKASDNAGQARKDDTLN